MKDSDMDKSFYDKIAKLFPSNKTKQIEQLQEESKAYENSARICHEWNLQISLKNMELEAENEYLQYQIDKLMIEYCPDEMTEEQMKNWEKSQQKVEW